MQDQPNVKLCECGCGQPTPIAKVTKTARGHVKGKPIRFLLGHNARTPEGRGRPRLAPPNPSGFCQCGCGTTTAIATCSDASRGLVTGQHVRFVSGHNTRGISYSAIHTWLLRHHPKTGVCEHCHQHKKTEHAFLRHPDPHTRNRADYIELCRACHVIFDLAKS